MTKEEFINKVVGMKGVISNEPITIEKANDLADAVFGLSSYDDIYKLMIKIRETPS